MLDEKIAELEAACLEREDKIRILDADSLQQYEQIVTAIEAIGSIKQKVSDLCFGNQLTLLSSTLKLTTSPILRGKKAKLGMR